MKSFILKGICFWSLVVIIAWLIYPLGTEGWEAAGFMLAILGLPSSLLVNIIDPKASIVGQMVWFSILGYIQWPLIFAVWGIIITKKNHMENNP